MKKNQLDGKFIICRTQDEFDFICYYAEKLLNVNIKLTFDHPVCIRLQPMNIYGRWGWNDVGDYESDPDYRDVKEEECSVLFGNLIKRWKHEHRT